MNEGNLSLDETFSLETNRLRKKEELSKRKRQKRQQHPDLVTTSGVSITENAFPSSDSTSGKDDTSSVTSKAERNADIYDDMRSEKGLLQSPSSKSQSDKIQEAILPKENRDIQEARKHKSTLKPLTIEFGRLHFPNSQEPNLDIDTFLLLYPPTQKISSCNWIQVHCPDKRDSEQSTNPNGSTNLQHEILKEFAKKGNARISGAIKKDYLDRLCQCALGTTGKWMLFCKPERVNTVWAEVAKNVFEGKLGVSAKVANKDRHNNETEGGNVGSFNDENYLICVYVSNFQDEAEVRRVLRVLLRMECKEPVTAGFKPDFMTELRIYKDKAMNPPEYPNAHKLLSMGGLYKDMLKEEKRKLQINTVFSEICTSRERKEAADS